MGCFFKKCKTGDQNPGRPFYKKDVDRFEGGQSQQSYFWRVEESVQGVTGLRSEQKLRKSFNGSPSPCQSQSSFLFLESHHCCKVKYKHSSLNLSFVHSLFESFPYSFFPSSFSQLCFIYKLIKIARTHTHTQIHLFVMTTRFTACTSCLQM